MTVEQTPARVAVTGTGVVSPIGIGTESFWSSALAGIDGMREVTRFDTSGLRSHRAGEIVDFRPQDHLSRSQIETMGRASQLAVAAARMAVEEAGLEAADSYPVHRRAVCMGTTMGEPEILDEIATGVALRGLDGFPHQLIFPLPCFRIPNHVAQALDFGGPNYQIPTACAAGNYAIGYGCDLLRLGRADVVAAGGSDALSRIALAGFNRLLAHAPDRCRPFDLDRAGMMVSEGAGCLILERLDDALDRGAQVLAEVLDYGLGCDAHKMTIPHPEGRGGVLALRGALERSAVGPDQVDYLCAHGTGTRENDKVETVIVKEVLGEHAHRTPMSSLKSMIGHTMGAASALEAVACVRVVREGRIPPTINYSTPDPDCDLDCVPNFARTQPVAVAASNAYAFGGNCSSLVIRRARGEA